MSDTFEQRIIEDVTATRDTRHRFGRYRGLVEDVEDPQGLERVRVRVWAVHGPASRTPTEALPWADRSSESGGAVDMGSSLPLPVGASVWVEFEMGIERFPIVVGTFRGAPVANDANPQVVKSGDGLPYQPPDGKPETPGEVFGDRSNLARNPTVAVAFKTQKGAALVAEEGDGREKTRLIDRAGQALELWAPTSKDANRGSGCNNGNAARRGTRTALRGDQLPSEALKHRSAHARLRDTAGQEVMLEAKEGKERALLRSRNQLGTTEALLELRTGRDNPGVTLQDKAGAKLEMDSSGARGVNLQDAQGNRMSLLPGGSFELNSVTELRVSTGKDRVSEVGGSDQGTTQGDDNRDILGNLKRTIGGGVNVGAMGGAQISLGGLLQLLVTNAPQPSIPPSIPKPTDNAVEITIAIGGFKFKTLVGSIALEAGATPGVDKVMVGSANPVSCIEPILCGNIWAALMVTILQALLTHTHATPAGPATPSPELAASFASLIAMLSDPTAANPADPRSLVSVTEKVHVPSV